MERFVVMASSFETRLFSCYRQFSEAGLVSRIDFDIRVPASIHRAAFAQAAFLVFFSIVFIRNDSWTPEKARTALHVRKTQDVPDEFVMAPTAPQRHFKQQIRQMLKRQGSGWRKSNASRARSQAY